MGYAKRMLEEERAREYHTSSDTVCFRCFDDAGIRAFVKDHLLSKSCSVCGRTSSRNIAAPADEVLKFFLSKIYEHYEDANDSAPWDGREGGYQVSTYSMYELVFRMNSDIADHQTLLWLYSHLKDDVVLCDRDWQIMSLGDALEVGWSSFAESVKHTTRFLFFPKGEEEPDLGEPYHLHPGEMLEQLGEVIRECNLIQKIPAGTRLFRARGHEMGRTYTQAKDLGPPPIECAKTAGRMNAAGIVVFYGAYEKNTALAEATGDYPFFSVAEFETLTDLTLVDLTKLPPVPSIFEPGPRESLRFLHYFAKKVSQPFEPDAELHIDYTPTQVVSEFIRHRLHDAEGEPVRGLVYVSARRPETANVSLFIQSPEIEGVSTQRWQKKVPVLRLVSVEEATASEADRHGLLHQ